MFQGVLEDIAERERVPAFVLSLFHDEMMRRRASSERTRPNVLWSDQDGRAMIRVPEARFLQSQGWRKRASARSSSSIAKPFGHERRFQSIPAREREGSPCRPRMDRMGRSACRRRLMGRSDAVRRVGSKASADGRGMGESGTRLDQRRWPWGDELGAAGVSVVERSPHLVLPVVGGRVGVTSGSRIFASSGVDLGCSGKAGRPYRARRPLARSH